MQEYTIDRVLVGRLPVGADLLEGLTTLCREQNVQAGHVEVIGALTESRLGWYDPGERRYHGFEVNELAELLHASGNVALLDGRPFIHLHAVLALRDERTFGGHVQEGCKVFVAEYRITCYRGEPLQREADSQTGLKLWRAE